ncbi:gag polyprotein [Lasius niger]|uniref:Gag polyprotein n=1 Tax=Lasius niger TaxID=67767 RepID=A0A0J7K235_LASNI|nr:gag polyprotein [Lasius niger]
MTSRSVLRKIATQLEAAAEQDPQFWAGLREEIGRTQMEQSARQHRVAQTAGPLLDVAVQIAPATEERATQTDRAAGDTDSSGAEGSEHHVKRRPPTHPWPPGGCWNCANITHIYSECPRPRDITFCYRCGRVGTTVRDCPRCQKDWRAQGPYRPGRGSGTSPAHWTVNPAETRFATPPIRTPFGYRFKH